MRRVPWLIMAAGAVAALALLSARGQPTALWVALPLGAWLLAAPAAYAIPPDGTTPRGSGSPRGPTAPRRSTAPRGSIAPTVRAAVSVGVQVAVIVGLAVAASGHVGLGPDSPSFWDAALAYDVMALVALVAAWLVRQFPPELPGRYPRPTPTRRRLARAASVAGPIWLVAVGCLGLVVALPVTPPTPPRALVHPLPDGVVVEYVRFRCGPGPRVTCTWSTDVRESTTADRLAARIDAHLARTKEWGRTPPRCRTWGWTLTERACVSVEVRGVIVAVVAGDHPFDGSLDGPVEVPPELWNRARLAVVVTYP